MRKVLILNYHKLIDSLENESVEAVLKSTVQPQHGSKRHSKFSISKASFIQQLDLIKLANTYETIITFDDGNSSDFTIAYPLLKENKLNAIFFPVISTIGTEDHLTWEQLGELFQSGFDIGSHTLSHRDLTKLSPDEVQFELSESKKVLEEKLGTEITTLALPYGKSNKTIIEIARQVGYKTVFSTNGGTSSQSDFFQHRWNIKYTMSNDTFEKILRGSKTAHFVKKSRSNLKRIVDYPFGTQLNKPNKIND